MGTKLLNQMAGNRESTLQEIIEKAGTKEEDRELAWRRTVRILLDERGMTEDDLKAYLGTGEKGTLVDKVPKKREHIIGIGICLNQPLEVINSWIRKLTKHRPLYIKDCFIGDLAWIYLIRVSAEDCSAELNYYRMHSNVQDFIKRTHDLLLEEQMGNHSAERTEKFSDATELMVTDFEKYVTVFEDDYASLYRFMQKNLTLFDTAYAKSRNYVTERLTSLAGLIVKHQARDEVKNVDKPLHGLKTAGVINSSVCNYLMGDNAALIAARVPALRHKHICLALCCCFSLNEVNSYLELMNFEPLTPKRGIARGDASELYLMRGLRQWEIEHPKGALLQKRYFEKEECEVLELTEEAEALEDLLGISAYLEDYFDEQGADFSYYQPKTRDDAKGMAWYNAVSPLLKQRKMTAADLAEGIGIKSKQGLLMDVPPRETVIRIGIYLEQPMSVINHWLTEICGYRPMQ